MLSSTPISLPKNFVPKEQHVLIGRGRAVRMMPGNVKFDALIQRFAPEYKEAPCKAEKGNILSQIINEIYDAAPDAGFVRKDPQSGDWELVCETLARQTVAQAMRNALHTSYRSSKQFKSKRRMIQIQQQQTTVAPDSFQITMPARCVSPSDNSSSRCSSRRSSHSSIDSTESDTLELLMAAFASSEMEAGNPFEPRPIAEEIDLFEPLPFSL